MVVSSLSFFLEGLNTNFYIKQIGIQHCVIFLIVSKKKLFIYSKNHLTYKNIILNILYNGFFLILFLFQLNIDITFLCSSIKI